MLTTRNVVVSKCSQCDCGKERPIVNKKYFLCTKKNGERLAKNKKPTNRISGARSFIRNNSIHLFNKKRRYIKRVSSTNRYRTSSGELVTQSEINKRYKETCDRIDMEREPVCEGTGRNDLPLSHSHTISRKRCKEIGKVELIWDPENLFLESYHEPSSKPYAAHNIWENGSLDQKKTLLNFDRKLEYIRKYDPELYQKLT